jgi:hypothetical protein
MPKISVKTTSFIIAITVLYTVVVLIAMELILTNQHAGTYFTLLRETLFITPVFYMLRVLVHFHEKRSIIVAFWFFVVMDILIALTSLAVTPNTNGTLLLGYFSLIFVIIVITLVILFFKIQNDELMYPYVLFGFSYIAYIFLTYTGIFVLGATKQIIVYYISIFSVLLIPVSMFYALFKISKYIAKLDKLNATIAQFGNNPGNIEEV